MRRVVLAGVMGLLLGACGGGASAPPAGGPQTHRAGGCAVTFPAGWKVTAGELGFLLVARGPQENPADFVPNVNVIGVDMAGGEDPQVFLDRELAAGRWQKRYKDYTVLESRDTKQVDMLGRRLVFTYDPAGRSAKVLQVMSYTIAGKGRAYSVVCTATLEQFPKVRAAFEEVCASLAMER